jgi:hypothetical protein
MTCTVPNLIAGGNEYRNFSRRQLSSLQAYLLNRLGASTNVASVVSARAQWDPQMDPDIGLRLLTKQAWKLANQASPGFTEDAAVHWAQAQQQGFARLSTEELEYLVPILLCSGAIP